MSSTVPEGWQISSVENLLTPDCLFSDGDWVESKDQDPAGTNRLLQLADIGDGRFVNKSNRFMNDEQFNRLNCTQLQEGDVLIARMPEPIGRACILPRLDNRLATVVDIAILRPSAVDSYWLMSVINSAGFRTKIEEQSSGTTRTRIGRTALSKIKLLSPPLPEQKKIASILTSVDEVIENTQKQIDKLQDLKKATMNELLTKGIGHKEFKDSELGQIPKSWDVQPLLKLSKGRFGIVDGPFGSNLKTEHYKSKGIPVIQSGFVTTGQFYAKKYVYVDSEKFNAEIRSAVASGDIVMAKIGAQAGRCAIMPAGHSTGILAGNSLKITTDEESLLATYLNHLLSHLYTTGEIQNLRTETAQPAISIATLKRYKIKVPTLLEQQKITKVLSTIDIKLKSTGEKSEKLQSLKKSLMQDLLTGKVRVTVN